MANITDAVSLMTKGYKAGEIKEIFSLSKDNEEIIELAKSAGNMSDFKSLLELIGDPEDKSDPKDEPPADDQKNSDTTPEEDKEKDELKKQLEETKKQLEEAQKKNAAADISGGQKTLDEQLDEFAQIVLG